MEPSEPHASPTEQLFEELKLKVYQPGIFLGLLATLCVLGIMWLGRIPLQTDDLIIPAMSAYCLASLLLFRFLGVRYLRIFETTTIIIVFIYFAWGFAYSVWNSPAATLIDFRRLEFWFPLVYTLSFLIFRSQRALRTSLAFFLVILAIGIANEFLIRNRPVDWDNLLLLTQLYASSLIYIALLYVIALLKDRYGEAEARSSRMTRLAMVDDLTGLHNRRKINDLLKTYVEDFKRYGRQFSVIMLDVDGLKRINDTYGHDAGDEVLRRMVRVLRSNVRETDQVARWGGDEFFVFYPDTGEEQVRKLARRLALAVHKVKFGDIGLVTFSLGTATVQPQDTADTLWKRADKAMYLAKRNKTLPLKSTRRD